MKMNLLLRLSGSVNENTDFKHQREQIMHNSRLFFIHSEALTETVVYLII
jgi:hypothetical protein